MRRRARRRYSGNYLSAGDGRCGCRSLLPPSHLDGVLPGLLRRTPSPTRAGTGKAVVMADYKLTAVQRQAALASTQRVRADLEQIRQSRMRPAVHDDGIPLTIDEVVALVREDHRDGFRAKLLAILGQSGTSDDDSA